MNFTITGGGAAKIGKRVKQGRELGLFVRRVGGQARFPRSSSSLP